MNKKRFSLSTFLWDLWCVISIVGIWPRFIEPKMLAVKRKTVAIPNIPPQLKGLKIAQFSDLHLNLGMTDRFIEKIVRKIREWEPDILVFTGDFLNRASLEDESRLKQVLNSFPIAKHGNYAILGNHDYDRFVSINADGEYDVLEDRGSPISKGMERLFSKSKLQKRWTERVAGLMPHKDLVRLLKDTPFQLLHNETIQIPIQDSFLNLTGLGEYLARRLDTGKAFEQYKKKFPGIVLVHNPDAIPDLLKEAGEIILCGHTHGGQINLPLIHKKITVMEHPQFKRGEFYLNGKWIYVSVGIGSIMTFRWFAMPEIVFLTLK